MTSSWLLNSIFITQEERGRHFNKNYTPWSTQSSSDALIITKSGSRIRYILIECDDQNNWHKTRPFPLSSPGISVYIEIPAISQQRSYYRFVNPFDCELQVANTNHNYIFTTVCKSHCEVLEQIMPLSTRMDAFRITLPCFFLPVYSELIRWDRVTHICVSKLTIIGSDNGWSAPNHIWTNAGILLIRTLGSKFSDILSEIRTF